MRSGETERYTSLAQVTHWAAAVLMLAAVVLAWVFMAMPADQAGRFVYITLHKSIGQTIFFLTLFRLIWRRFHPAPPMGGRIAAWEALIARANHRLLYAIMILMPLTGYILATAAARPSPYFWLFYWPQPAVSRVVAHAALRAHLVGQYLVYAMAGLHVAAVVWHVVVRQDGTLERMLPAQDGPGTGSAVCPRSPPPTATKRLP
jgi:cytochrome b561